MISVDEAIQRSTDLWHPNITHVEAETAYQDRTILADEVVALRESLAEADQEIRSMRHQIDHEEPY